MQFLTPDKNFPAPKVQTKVIKGEKSQQTYKTYYNNTGLAASSRVTVNLGDYQVLQRCRVRKIELCGYKTAAAGAGPYGEVAVALEVFQPTGYFLGTDFPRVVNYGSVAASMGANLELFKPVNNNLCIEFDVNNSSMILTPNATISFLASAYGTFNLNDELKISLFVTVESL
jgi:hypothetical protein